MKCFHKTIKTKCIKDTVEHLAAVSKNIEELKICTCDDNCIIPSEELSKFEVKSKSILEQLRLCLEEMEKLENEIKNEIGLRKA
jgi:hypothetical protein